MEKKFKAWVKAEKLGLKMMTISNYEHGLTSPKLETLLKIAELFEVSLDDLVCSKLSIEITTKSV